MSDDLEIVSLRKEMSSIKRTLFVCMILLAMIEAVVTIGIFLAPGMNKPVEVAVNPRNPLFCVMHGYDTTQKEKPGIRMVRVDENGNLMTSWSTTSWSIPQDASKEAPRIKDEGK